MSGNGITLPVSVVRPNKQDEYLHYLGMGDGSGPGIDFAPLGEILDMENAYKEFSNNLAHTLEVELAQVRAAGDTSVLPPLQAFVRELGVRDHLLARKASALPSAKSTASQRFGQTQVDTFLMRGRLPQINRRAGTSGVSVREAYAALFNAKLLAEGIALLNAQSVNVKGVIATLQAQEASRVAQEQARLAAEHARQVAQEQARIAQEQARRVAEELARIAAENEVRRLAEERARIAAQAHAKEMAEALARLEAENLARQRAEEQARIEAAEQAQRLVDDELRRLELAGAANTYRVGAAAHAQLGFTMPNGVMELAEDVIVALRAAIRAAIATLSSLAAGTATGFMVGVGVLVYSPELANGELPKRYMFSYPLSDFMSGPLPDLDDLAKQGGLLDVPVRFSSRATEDDQSELLVVPVDGVSLPAGVPVVAAVHNPQENVYSAIIPDVPPRTLVWTPLITPDSSSTALPVQEPSPPRYAGGVIIPAEGRIDSHPAVGEAGFDDYIIVFPADSGLPPQYIMFRDPREDAGVATGDGEPVVGRWLEAASQGDGAPIPSQIAEQLRGRQFRNFRAFREAFWKAVPTDMELAKSFDQGSLNEMNKGRAPFVRVADRAGKRVKFELHHSTALASGGALYDSDNLRVLTPKGHVEIHRGNKK
ncbi:S-type pyocin domain-containing protein [Pseudomonas sp. NPDC089918]|uniref:S-type pyocin domain-containing protein n=1 Tax=Pseudomonas sp. NPDC089918 TaxID=3390654 RepID=UPI003D07BEA3